VATIKAKGREFGEHLADARDKPLAFTAFPPGLAPRQAPVNGSSAMACFGANASECQKMPPYRGLRVLPDETTKTVSPHLLAAALASKVSAPGGLPKDHRLLDHQNRTFP
jgi:hypothetical protein